MVVVLHLRFKMLMIDFYFSKIYGIDVVEQMKKVCNICDEIFTYYEAKSTIVRREVVSGSFSTVVHSHQTQSRSVLFDLSEFDSFASQNRQSKISKSELERYLEEPLVEKTVDVEVLTWWKRNKGKYPILAKIAKDILAIPVMTVASEYTFSTGDTNFLVFKSKNTYPHILSPKNNEYQF